MFAAACVKNLPPHASSSISPLPSFAPRLSSPSLHLASTPILSPQDSLPPRRQAWPPTHSTYTHGGGHWPSPLCGWLGWRLVLLVLFRLSAPSRRAFYGVCRSRSTLYRAEHHTPVGRALRSYTLGPSRGLAALTHVCPFTHIVPCSPFTCYLVKHCVFIPPNALEPYLVRCSFSCREAAINSSCAF